MSRRGWILFVAMGVVWGTPYLLIKVAVSDLSPAAIVLARTAIAALVLVPLAAARGELRPVLRRWRPLIAFAVAEMTIPWFLLTSAEQRLTSSLSGLLIAGVPMVSALIGWSTGHERLVGRRVVGLLIGIAGVAALVGLDLGHADPWGLLQMAGVVIGYALGPFVLTRWLADLPALGVIAAALAATSAAYLVPGIAQMPADMPRATVVWAIVTLGLLCTALAFVGFFALLAEVGPVRSTVITYINPAVAVVLGITFLNEPVTIGIGVGFVLVLAGSVLATQRTPMRRQLEPAPDPQCRPALAES